MTSLHDPNGLEQWLQLLKVLLAIVRQLPTVVRTLTELVRVWRAPKGGGPQRRGSNTRR